MLGFVVLATLVVVSGRSWDDLSSCDAEEVVTDGRLWLEPGREDASGEEGVSPRVEGTSLDKPLLCKEVGLPPATESPLLRPVFDLTLHLLLTLSERFIIALSTKPPKPLVGETGRFCERALEVRSKLGVDSSEFMLSVLSGRLLIVS